MSSTMHIIALIEQKTRQNGLDVGIGKYRCEENQFGTFRFKVSPSTRLTKYCQPFSEGDVVILVGKFAYEIVEKAEGFTINVTVATPYPKPSSGCWETEEIPLSSPYLSFNTQPIPGSLRQIENCQFIRTKSIIDCNFTRRSTDIRFRIGYQTDNERFENMASIWDAYSQFFISGFFLHADNCELHIEAIEVDCDPATKKSNKIQTSPTGYSVSNISPLAKNLSKLLEQERTSTVIPMPRTPLEHQFLRPINIRNSNSTNSQFTPPPVQDANSQDSLQQDFYKEQPQPSAEQIAELIGDQGMHQDNNGAINSKHFNHGGGSSNSGSSGGSLTSVITSNSPKRGRRSKNELTVTNPRPTKKSRNSKKTNIEEDVTPKEGKDVGVGDTNESSDAVTTTLPVEVGSFDIQK
ncbi:9369_t:CDS:2 [Diversispora eburnea]|uniref:9369_t:CDS:1 n=1 Tax=Diversispora eburnea TaxID=1213867 RepID=A0A9N8V3A2_9GLOM|nr:9369_t:CDS:2 [Diversispora eburnea]